MSGSVSNEIKAEPNLTPLLDVVFQLITFFMLVINFSNDNNDQRVRLPVAPSAVSPESSKAEDDKIILNIDADGNLIWNGEVFDTEKAIKQIKITAEHERLIAERAMKGKKIDVEKDGLPSTIVIRSDRDTECSHVYRLITACQSNGFRKFVLKAMNGKG